MRPVFGGLARYERSVGTERIRRRFAPSTAVMWQDLASTAHQIGGVTALAGVCLLQYVWHLAARRRLRSQHDVLQAELNATRRELQAAQAVSSGALVENLVLCDLLAEADSNVALRRLLQAFVLVDTAGVAAYFRRDESWQLHDAVGMDRRHGQSIHPDQRLLAALGRQMSLVLDSGQVEQTQLGRGLAHAVGARLSQLYLFRTASLGELLDGVIVTSELPDTGGSIPDRVRVVERLVAAAGRYFHRSAMAAAQEQELRMTREILELRSVVDLEFSSPQQMVEQFLDRLMAVCEFDHAGVYLLRRRDGVLTLLSGSKSYPPRVDAGAWAASERAVAEHSVRDLKLVCHSEKDLQVLCGGSPFRSAITIPMHVGGEPAGVLVLTGQRSATLTEADRELLHWSGEYLLETILRTVDRASIEARASRDGLTGLANRHAFDTAIEQYVERSVHSGRDCTLILLDLDHFKRINDRYGHPAGDAALKAVASVIEEELRLHVRGTDHPLAARYGGEELAVLLPHVGLNGGLRVAERIRARVADTVVSTDTGDLQVTLSAGVAVAPAQATSPAQLIRAADRALYRAKQNGRDVVMAARSETVAKSDGSGAPDVAATVEA
jgi:diguanylate cyclase (GGDEF)-like protein